jgi:hypothetical protein
MSDIYFLSSSSDTDSVKLRGVFAAGSIVKTTIEDPVINDIYNKVSLTFTVPADTDPSTFSIGIGCSQLNIGNILAITDVQLEKGYLATNWTNNATEIASDIGRGWAADYDSKEPTGFILDAGSVLPLSSEIIITGGEVVLRPKSPYTSFSFYYRGSKYNVSEALSITILPADAGNTIVVCLNANGLYRYTSGIDVRDNEITVFSGYWDGTAFVTQEDQRHGCQMDGATRVKLHNSVGTEYISGFELSDFTAYGGDGSSNLHCSFSIDDGVVLDEDLKQNISGVSIGDFGVKVLYYDYVSGVYKTQDREYSMLHFPVL